MRADLDARITAAKAALDGARATANHSPNADTLAAETHCEHTLNRLLDERHAQALADKMVRH